MYHTDIITEKRKVLKCVFLFDTIVMFTRIMFIWGVGAAGSAFDWQSRGHGFESRTLHHNEIVRTLRLFAVFQRFWRFFDTSVESFPNSPIDNKYCIFLVHDLFQAPDLSGAFRIFIADLFSSRHPDTLISELPKRRCRTCSSQNSDLRMMKSGSSSWHLSNSRTS